MTSRIYDESIPVDYSLINNFFEQRASQASHLAAVMICTPSEQEMAEKRNTNETLVLQSLLEAKKNITILDLGCGMGRWINNLKSSFLTYTGVDFTKHFIERAEKAHKDEKNIRLYHASVLDLPQNVVDQEYDLVIVNGLCLYINDTDLPLLFNNIKKMLGKKGSLYFRESVATMGKRLTLKDFFSEKLKTKYNAIYRVPEEYERLFAEKLPSFRIKKSEYLLDKTTGVQEETNQKYWFLHSHTPLA